MNDKKIVNHRTDGEIGKIFNHNVAGAIGYAPLSIVNHKLDDAAPNSSQILNDEIKNEEELARRLGLFKYPGRVLGTTNPGDIIQLNSELKENWDWIVSHYSQIGLQHSKNVIWDDDFSLFADYPKHNVSVFFFGEKAHQARSDNQWFSITQFMNSKNNFIRLCKDYNVQVPKTFCFVSKNDVQDCNDFCFPVYLKISTSVSGLGVMKCYNGNELEMQLSKIGDGIEFQIQAEVDAISFLNVQYNINGSCNRWLVTEQVLEGCEHAGNKYPINYNPWEITDPLARMMWESGMKGYFAFDVAVTRDRQMLAIECNPRYNGSTYPSNVAMKLGIPRWVSKSFKTKYSNLNEINFNDLEYNPVEKKGVVVINWGCVSDNKLAILIAGTSDEQVITEKKLNKILL